PSLGERDGGFAVGRLADHADVRRTAEREAKPLAHDLVVVDDQTGDLGGSQRPGDHRTELSYHITAICSCSATAGGSSGSRRRSRTPWLRARARTRFRTGSVSLRG